MRREPGSWLLDWAWGTGPRQARCLAFAHTEGPLRLAPRLADRPVIVRPSEPLLVAPEEEVLLFAVTPLWVSLQAADGRQPLVELPCTRLSLTWFGADTRVGELCLAGRRPLCATPATEPCRARTPVRIHNHTEEPLPVERLRLPLPRMPLFQTAEGAFWTPQVAVRRSGKGEVALTLTDKPPDGLQRPREVAEAREAHQGNAMLEALGSVLHRPLFS
ncbi:MAG: hypothetical protein ABIO70_12865 [Pseudomonadota bacterium]